MSTLCLRGGKAGSAVKNVHYSSRGLKFGSQHTYWAAPSPSPGDTNALVWTLWPSTLTCTHTHPDIYTKLKRGTRCLDLNPLKNVFCVYYNYFVVLHSTSGSIFSLVSYKVWKLSQNLLVCLNVFVYLSVCPSLSPFSIAPALVESSFFQLNCFGPFVKNQLSTHLWIGLDSLFEFCICSLDLCIHPSVGIMNSWLL